VAVLCPPLFSEHTVTHFTYLSLARALSAAGMWVVRFDYEGTGDSAGAPAAAGQVAAWLASVDRAVELAHAYCNGPLALAGMRMGALLSAIAAQRRRDVDALVLWDPCSSGRTFLRSQQVLQAQRFAGGGLDGVVEVPGYALDATFADELGALSLPTVLRARRALVLARPDQALGELQVDPGRGVGALAPADMLRLEPGEQEALLEVEPLVHSVPTGSVARMARWMCGTLGSIAPVPAPSEPVPSLPHLHRRSATPVAMRVPRAGSESLVWERSVRLGSLGLFGIETLPAGSEGSPMPGVHGCPVVVFLSSGVDRHTGPSRLWVALARAWATEGVRCVRVDLSGLGESPTRPGRAEQVLRQPEAFDDVLDVAAAVAGDPRDVVLVGLCSGGYQALESALELAPRGVLAINPLLRFTPPELLEGVAISSRRRICTPKQPWVGSLRSRVPHRAASLVVTARAAWARARADRGAEGWLGELVRKGVRVYCVCGEDEARPLQRTSAAARASWWSSGHVRIEVVPRLDHGLLPAVQREVVCARLGEELRRILGDDACSAPAEGGVPTLPEPACGRPPVRSS
jgi:alpha-beta hydrolase superfamily lysophospholipase